MIASATCEHCHQPFAFERRGTTPKACSPECHRLRSNAMRRQRDRKPARTVQCIHHECGRTFTAETVRGAQRLTCSAECATARKAFLRRIVRRERYRALVAAGATQSVASDGSQGYRSFRAALAMLAENPELRRQPPKPRRQAEPRTPGRLLDLLRTRYPTPRKAHPWRERRSFGGGACT